jgi:aromatic ring hydroxylase
LSSGGTWIPASTLPTSTSYELTGRVLHHKALFVTYLHRDFDSETGKYSNLSASRAKTVEELRAVQGILSRAIRECKSLFSRARNLAAYQIGIPAHASRPDIPRRGIDRVIWPVRRH